MTDSTALHYELWVVDGKEDPAPVSYQGRPITATNGNLEMLKGIAQRQQQNADLQFLVVSVEETESGTRPVRNAKVGHILTTTNIRVQRTVVFIPKKEG